MADFLAPLQSTRSGAQGGQLQTAQFLWKDMGDGSWAPVVFCHPNKPYSNAVADWSYAAPSGGLVSSTTPVMVKAAPAAGMRNYISGFSVNVGTVLAGLEFSLREVGGAVLFRIPIPLAGLGTGFYPTFRTPIRPATDKAIEIVTSISTLGAIYFNAQGYEDV